MHMAYGISDGVMLLLKKLRWSRFHTRLFAHAVREIVTTWLLYFVIALLFTDHLKVLWDMCKSDVAAKVHA